MEIKRNILPSQTEQQEVFEEYMCVYEDDPKIEHFWILALPNKTDKDREREYLYGMAKDVIRYVSTYPQYWLLTPGCDPEWKRGNLWTVPHKHITPDFIEERYKIIRQLEQTKRNLEKENKNLDELMKKL